MKSVAVSWHKNAALIVEKCTMVRQSIRERLVHFVRANAGEEFLELILNEAKECVDIFVRDNVPANTLGTSRLGGLPDLPADQVWPKGLDEHGKPWRYADFLAQLNFEEIPRMDGLPLPPKGHLWLFMRGWRNTQVSLAAISELKSSSPLFVRELPTETEWAVFPTLGLEDDRPMTTGTLPLRFEIGISLPFGKREFVDAFGHAPRLANALYDAFQPSCLQGRIGGYAYDTAGGNDHRLNIELAQHGMWDYRSPYTFSTVSELDRAITMLSAQLSRKPDILRVSQANLEKLRPRAVWVEAHRNELNEWSPFLCLRPNDLIDLTWGTDTANLWTCIRGSDLLASRFDNLAGLTAS